MNEAYLSFAEGVTTLFCHFFELAVKGLLTTEDELDSFLWLHFDAGCTVDETVDQLHKMLGVAKFVDDYQGWTNEVDDLLYHRERQSISGFLKSMFDDDADAEQFAWGHFCNGTTPVAMFELCDQT